VSLGSTKVQFQVGQHLAKCIVLGDTLLDNFSADEIEMVLAHELGAPRAQGHRQGHPGPVGADSGRAVAAQPNVHLTVLCTKVSSAIFKDLTLT
jgi:hypothetical protein